MIVLFSSLYSLFQKQLSILKKSFPAVLVLALTACGGGVVGDANNFVIVKDQTVEHLNEIVIESATVDKDVIVVVYAAKTDEPIESPDKNKVLGYSALAAGEHETVKILLSRNTQNNETLFVELLDDNGIVGQLESDTIDTVISQSTVTTVSFAVMHAIVHIEVVEETNVLGQYTAPNPERIDIKEVIVESASWLVVHRNNDDALGDIIGVQPLSAGYSSNVSIWLNPKSQLSNEDRVFVVIYNDATEAVDNFDQNEDFPVMLNGKIVQLSLEIVL